MSGIIGILFRLFGSPCEQRLNRYRKHARTCLQSRGSLIEISPSDPGASLQMPMTVMELHHLHEQTAEMIWKALRREKCTIEWIGNIGTMKYLGAEYLEGYSARSILSDPSDARCWFALRLRIIFPSSGA